MVLFGIVLCVALDALAQSLPPHYSPLSEAESDLVVGPFGFIMTINFVNRGLLSLLFLYAFRSTMKHRVMEESRMRAGSYLLGMWSVGTLLLAFFPTDVPSTPMSWHGAAHLVVAIIAFIGGAFGVVLLSVSLKQANNKLGSLSKVGPLISYFAVLFWVVEFFLPFVAPHLNSRIGGMTERLFLGSALLWIGTVSAYFALNLGRAKGLARVENNEKG